MYVLDEIVDAEGVSEPRVKCPLPERGEVLLKFKVVCLKVCEA